MARGKRSLRVEFIFGLIVVFIIVLALLLDWWKEHAVIGWTIIGILVVLFGFSLYKFPTFRGWIFKKGAIVGKKVVYEEGAPGREQIPQNLYNKVMHRANYHCQNPDCKYRGKPQIHHINQDNSDNRFWNLIALCPNCHNDAHNGKLAHSQLRNFIRYSTGRKRF